MGVGGGQNRIMDAIKSPILSNSQTSVGLSLLQGRLSQRRQAPGRVGIPPLLLLTESSVPGLDSSDQGMWSSSKASKVLVKVPAL